MHTQLLRSLPLHFLLSQTCNLSLAFPSFFPRSPPPPPSSSTSLHVRGLAAADIWSGCLVIDWQVMRRLKGRWRQEQVFSTVFLASTKLPCPSLLQRTTPLPPSLTHSFPPSFLPSFHHPPPPFLFLREADYAIHHTVTRSDIYCLYMGKNAWAMEINRETNIESHAGSSKLGLGLISQTVSRRGWDWFGASCAEETDMGFFRCWYWYRYDFLTSWYDSKS